VNCHKENNCKFSFLWNLPTDLHSGYAYLHSLLLVMFFSIISENVSTVKRKTNSIVLIYLGCYKEIPLSAWLKQQKFTIASLQAEKS
jgi:hypothetical protein